VRSGYLESVRPATGGTPGSYRFGAKATARGAAMAPAATPEALPQFDNAA